MEKVSYEYKSKDSPVVMREKVGNWVVAEYTAYIDRSGTRWHLYPKRRIAACRDVPFEKKTISIRQVTILPNPDIKLPKPRWEEDPPEKETRIL